MRKWIIKCRFCGAEGYEDRNDPAPGICPSCLDQRMNEATEKINGETTVAEAIRILNEVGLTTTAARNFVATAMLGKVIHAN